jgi:hypothetical protein
VEYTEEKNVEEVGTMCINRPRLSTRDVNCLSTRIEGRVEASLSVVITNDIARRGERMSIVGHACELA